jgi:predicted metalloendopeptidase
LCVEVAKLVAPVALGSLYISEYFTESDKQSAESLVESILDEYVSTINASDWMDDSTKQTAKLKTSTIKKFIGYHEMLRSEEATRFYDDISLLDKDKYLEMALSLHVDATDREFRRLYAKSRDDWTK